MNDSVVAIVSAFFIIGITVGIIAVVAMSVLRSGRSGHPGGPEEYEPAEPGERPHAPGWDDAVPDEHPRWPGDTKNDFTNG
jgi:hypothetical protein